MIAVDAVPGAGVADHVAVAHQARERLVGGGGALEREAKRGVVGGADRLRDAQRERGSRPWRSAAANSANMASIGTRALAVSAARGRSTSASMARGGSPSAIAASAARATTDAAIVGGMAPIVARRRAGARYWNA